MSAPPINVEPARQVSAVAQHTAEQEYEVKDDYKSHFRVGNFVAIIIF